MIDFVAHISFDGINKEKKLYLDTRSKNIPSPYSVKSYQDQNTQIIYSICNGNEFIKKTSDKKFLILAFICAEDRVKLRQILKIPDIDIKTDPELLLDLYLKYGEDQLKILSNGFVFIMVDYHNKTVKAFRDHIGIKNICYYQLDNTIYLSSSFKNLFKLSYLSHTLNQDMVINFLKFNDHSPSDTFTNEIKKVPPMKALKFCKEKINIYKYLNYETNRSTTMPHVNQIKGLKKLLLQSVAIEGSRNNSRVGFLFSGGIDSSTVIMFFRKQKRANEEIYSFSAQYKHIDKNIKHLIDESEFQNEIQKLDDVNGFSFNGEDESTLSNLDFYLEIIGQPFFFPNLYLPNRAFNLAKENNIRIVMNGNDGDTVVSHGYEYLLELFFSLRWVRLYREINATSKTRQQRRRFIFKHIILKNISFQSFIKKSSRNKHLEIVLSNIHNKAIEIQTLLADHYGIQERYPFYNRDVVEYCINVSPELKHKNGQSRFILKEAIRGIVPEKIRTRVTKSNLGHALCIGYTNKDRAVIQEQFSKPHVLIKDIIDIENLQKSWNSLLQNPRKYSTRSQIPSEIFAYTVLNKWLNKYF